MTTFIFVVTSSCYLRMRKNNHVLRSAPLPIIQSQLLGPFGKKIFRDVTIAFHKRLSEYFKAPNTHRCYSDLETDIRHGEENCQHRWFRKLVREAERHSFVCITFSFKMTLCFEYSSIFDSLHSRKQKYCQNFLRQLFLECT